MFILPVGHEQDELRRWPWISLTLAGLCIAVFCGLLLVEASSEKRAQAAAREALAYAEERPYLDVEEDLLFADTGESLTWSPIELFTNWDERREGTPQPGEQEELDRLTDLWREAEQSVPLRVLGLVPAEAEPWTFVSHLFAHAGWLHLIANLFFFWLLAPPLEDVWGRPLFLLFFLGAGVTAGLLWVARYPNSTVPIVGASGAIAGLMGAFMIRFWRARIRFVYALWVGLRIFAGSFKAPAWLMLGLWFARELGLASLIEPHVVPGGGVAVWAHVYGFGFGVLAAAAIQLLRIEERFVRPKVLAVTGALENPELEAAFGAERRGRAEHAWRLARATIAKRPDDWDAVVYLWDLACRSGREREAAPHLMRAIRHEAASGQLDLANGHWRELTERIPDLETPAALKLSLAEGMLDDGWSYPQVSDLLAAAGAQIGPDAPPGLRVKLARVGARAGMPGAAEMCERLSADSNLPETVRRELLALAETSRPESPTPEAAN